MCYTSQSKHQAPSKGQPGKRITPINTAAVHLCIACIALKQHLCIASAQQQPTIITRTQQGHHQILSANAAKYVLHGESSKRLATPRNTKDKKHLQSIQSAQPTNLTDQAPSTTERTARETHKHQITQQPRTLQHNNNPPSAPTPDRVITRSFQPTQPAAKPRSNTGGLVEQPGWLRRRAEPHNTIDPTRLSGDTQRPPAPPRLGGARHQLFM